MKNVLMLLSLAILGTVVAAAVYIFQIGNGNRSIKCKTVDSFYKKEKFGQCTNYYDYLYAEDIARTTAAKADDLDSDVGVMAFSCDEMIAAGMATCDEDFCATCGLAGYCDVSCEFNDGVCYSCPVGYPNMGGSLDNISGKGVYCCQDDEVCNDEGLSCHTPCLDCPYDTGCFAYSPSSSTCADCPWPPSSTTAEA
jgi:hypothetical protein